MKLIAGLGNPGRRYAGTRHNIGFMVVDSIAEEKQLRFRVGKGDFEITEYTVNNERVLLIKPTTYMNLSGTAVWQAMQYYHIAQEDLLIVCDDAALPLGKIRARKEGSDGGQKGLRSVIFQLNDDRFSRLRIGIGRHEQMELADYVLSRFTDEEKPLVQKVIGIAREAVNDFITKDITYVMNTYNGLVIQTDTE